MATTDLSRSAFDPRKRYAGVQMQQGRVILDSDWNEAGEIAAESVRRALLDIIGPHGTQDGGFQVTDPTLDATSNTIDFAIGAGSYYVGGLRASLDAAQRYRLQTDWLQHIPEAAPAAPRLDLVYLELWQQLVSAVEDDELREVALGGPDTSTRLRTMARVAVESAVGADGCAESWTEAVQRWLAAGAGALDAGHELATDVTLTVAYVEGDDDEDLCEPSVAGGYLGAENQAIRVQLVDANTLTWGFDNASPLYRIDLAANRTAVTLRNAPPDQEHWPLAGDVVEVLPWSAVLPNGEKVAEVGGHLTTVAESYRPDTGTLALTDAVPATFDRWASRDDAGALGDAFYYLRVWHRGSERDEPAAIACPAGTPVTLGHTGISVTIGGGHRRAGDHWIIAARPESPDRVVPWALEGGRAPHGIRRFRAPLAIVRWQDGGSGAITGSVVSDCRRPFHPLTQRRDCITYTVGDGSRSYGDFRSIQDAIDALPEAGGEVHVLPGDYSEAVRIADRHDVVLFGCGGESRLAAPGDASAALTIERCVDVAVRTLAVEALDAPCIAIGGPGEDVRPSAPLRGIELATLTLTARDFAAVTARGGRGVTLADSTIAVQPLVADLAAGEQGRWPAVVLAADDVRVERNTIRVNASAGARRTAHGGIQLAGGTEGARLIDNRIVGGNGHGITLGSVLYVPRPVAARVLTDWTALLEVATYVPAGFEIAVDEDGCVQWTPVPRPPADGTDEVLVPVSEGQLFDVEIRGNEITGTGGSGIAVARFFDLATEPDCIDVVRLRIERNVIVGCLRGEIAEAPARMRSFAGYGGIALAGVVRAAILDNRIESNGRSHLDPVCGVFVMHAEGIEVARNVVRGNGARAETAQTPRPGQRGGVVITLATPPPSDNVQGSAREDRMAMACTVVDNEVVAPEGRALRVTARGPVTVSRNYLASLGFSERTSHGSVNALAGDGRLTGFNAKSTAGMLPAALDFVGGAAVMIMNLGRPSDGAAGLSILQHAARKESDSAGAPGTSGGGVWDAVRRRREEPGGTVLFHDNHVVLSLSDTEAQPPQSSVLVLALDDASVQQNHCEIERGAVLINVYAYARSLRVADNRMAEPIRAPGILFSALTIGAMNTTSGNQGTHCIVAKGAAASDLLIDVANTSLVGAAIPELCASLGRIAVVAGAWTGAGDEVLAQADSSPQDVLALLG